MEGHGWFWLKNHAFHKLKATFFEPTHHLFSYLVHSFTIEKGEKDLVNRKYLKLSTEVMGCLKKPNQILAPNIFSIYKQFQYLQKEKIIFRAFETKLKEHTFRVNYTIRGNNIFLP